MKNSNLIAIDLAKSTFQVCVFDQHRKIKSNRSIRAADFTKYLAKQPPSVVAFEACSSAHYYARLAEQQGHQAKLYSAKVVERYRQGHKTDANDAAAIGYTAQQPSISTVATKSLEQQNTQSLLRIQQHFSDQLTATSNLLRGLLLEFGIRIPKGYAHLRRHIPLVLEDGENGLSFPLRNSIDMAWQQWQSTELHLKQIEITMTELIRSIESCSHLLAIEGIGPKNAIALYADMGDGTKYKNGRSAAACIGVTPVQHSTGGKTSIGHIRKGYMVNSRLRSTLITGAIAVLNVLEKRPAKNHKERWLKELLLRRGKRCAAVALVNKNVRTAWAMLAHNMPYQPPEQLDLPMPA